MAKRKPKRMDPVEITSDGEEFWAVGKFFNTWLREFRVDFTLEKIVAHRKVLRGKMVGYAL